ncbi:hypothetical protein C1752_08269 [Acaryochloris thomasi RCC1774]|uniref:Major royal jelly protein n=1 Tax=Acaryochloris thomasi RCC1774 TaxID=1764569 RepID=A0A2W1JAQ5_9CYAN|nr:L-dopachrome tautomerase-related protein [Acaryochloris thomasi]PZD71066.1 hypothetical protein C1752_08269 [Acaryochloris thomasi RCC1774]
MLKSAGRTTLVAAAMVFSTAFSASAQLETVVAFDADTPPGNLAIASNGRIFISVHGFYGEPTHHVLEVMKDGSTQPYPTPAWSGAPTGDGPGLNDVLGLQVDRNGILWMLDGQAKSQAGRLIAWDTRKEQLHKIMYLAAPVTTPDSFLNDLAVDRDHNAIYIADSAGAIIVVDIETGRARRVLDGSESTTPEDIDMVIDGETVIFGDAPARIGVNPITIDANNEWVYFGPMSSTSLYRIQAKDLRDTRLSQTALAQKVERYGDKTISDGSTVDTAGNVYITSITEDAIGVTGVDGNYRILHQDDTLSWPDGFAVGADGDIYFTVNELHRSPVLNGGEAANKGEFKIMRFKPLATAEAGR